MATDWIKWHIDRISEAANGGGNPYQSLGRIQHSIGELQKFYETGTLIHHTKTRSTMAKKPDELKHFPGDDEKDAPAQEATATPETPAAETAQAGTTE